MEKYEEERVKNKIEGFLESRIGWNRILAHPVPKHANNATYTLGGMLLVLGIVQGLTGVMLMQFYHPHPGVPGAYESVLQIAGMTNTAFVRNLHYWGAQFMIVIALLHMIRVFISGSYKKPRELQWLAGVGLLLLLFAFSFTGTILKYDQEAIEALGHQTELAGTMGAIGSIFTSSFTSSVPLLTRLYAMHVTIIPMLVLPVLALHIVLIRILGISSPKTDRTVAASVQEKVPYLSHVKRMLIYGAGVTMITVILAMIVPAPLGMRGLTGMEITMPPWYLLWMFPLEDLFGLGVVPYVTGLIVIVLGAVPLVDRKQITDPRRRKTMIIGMFVPDVNLHWSYDSRSNSTSRTASW